MGQAKNTRKNMAYTQQNKTKQTNKQTNKTKKKKVVSIVSKEIPYGSLYVGLTKKKLL